MPTTRSVYIPSFRFSFFYFKNRRMVIIIFLLPNPQTKSKNRKYHLLYLFSVSLLQDKIWKHKNGKTQSVVFTVPSFLVQSIWGQNGLNPPQQNCNKNQISTMLWGILWGFQKTHVHQNQPSGTFPTCTIYVWTLREHFETIGFGTFYQYGQIHVYFESIWFVFVIELSKTLHGMTNICWTNY